MNENRGSAALLLVLLLCAGACTTATSPPAGKPGSSPELATTTTATTVQASPAIVPDITPEWGSAALDLRTQTAFGFGVGYVPADALLTSMSAHLGPVTNDT